MEATPTLTIRNETTLGTPRLLRTINERVLLDHMRRQGRTSRAQLARDTGLSKPTVSQALANLERAGLVRVAGEASPGRGRVAVLYEPDPTAGYVVAVDIGRSWIRLAVADLSGRTVNRQDHRNEVTSADALVEMVSHLARDVVRAARVRWEDVVHVVVSSPGVFDPSRGQVMFASNLPGWGDSGLSAALERTLGPSLNVDNDANLAAIGEREFGAGRGTETFVFITIGTGVGMGIVVDGRLYRGSHGAAGEIAYLPMGADGKPGAPNEAAVDVTARGLLEKATAADAVVATARALGMADAATAEAVFAAARAGDDLAHRAVWLEGERLALAVASAAALLDPELIVLGGGIGGNFDLLEEPIQVRLAQLTPLRPQIVPSQLGQEAVLLGAIVTGVERAQDLVFHERAAAVS